MIEDPLKPTCMVGNPLETNMPDWRPVIARLFLIGDKHAGADTNMLDLRPMRHTYLTSDQLRVQN